MKLITKTFLLLTLVFTAGLLFVSIAHAQYMGFDVGSDTGLSSYDVRWNATQIIRSALSVLGIILLGVIIYSGFLWMTAGGNDDKVSEAKKWLTRSIIGLIIVLTSYMITSFVTTQIMNATGAQGGYTTKK